MTMQKDIVGHFECTNSFSKKFERMVREATDMCLRVLKERNKAMVVRNSILFVSHITFQDCHVHIFF